MRHYEIVLLTHPDQGDQMPAMIERYKTLITQNAGKIHRLEDWGRRTLAYQIEKLNKARYFLLNIECDFKLLKEIETAFRFNDIVLRFLITKVEKAITEPSAIMRSAEREENKKLAESLNQGSAKPSAQ